MGSEVREEGCQRLAIHGIRDHRAIKPLLSLALLEQQVAAAAPFEGNFSATRATDALFGPTM